MYPEPLAPYVYGNWPLEAADNTDADVYPFNLNRRSPLTLAAPDGLADGVLHLSAGSYSSGL